MNSKLNCQSFGANIEQEQDLKGSIEGNSVAIFANICFFFTLENHCIFPLIDFRMGLQCENGERKGQRRIDQNRNLISECQSLLNCPSGLTFIEADVRDKAGRERERERGIEDELNKKTTITGTLRA